MRRDRYIVMDLILFILGETLDKKVEWARRWRKYLPNPDSIISDLEEEYLASASPLRRTLLQERIERIITRGTPIEEETRNKKRSYEEQFYEGHAAQGGRIIEVESHIATRGKHQGKLLHFGQPANGRYIWIVDEEGNFIIANRQAFHHEMPQMNKAKLDYFHRLYKLPHATVAKGKSVYGSGEVLIESGLVREYNTASGHYLELDSVDQFNAQGKEVFEYFREKAGWEEAKSGAKYIFKKFRKRPT
ncbi:MAG: hypothetical protein AABX13_00780 [Nanoarchaeota archaeon]